MRRARGPMIGFIGAGTMGQALIQGLVRQGRAPSRLMAADPNPAIRARVARLGVRATAENPAVVRGSRVVVLAVKPQQLPGVSDEIAPHVTTRHLLISIAAGITLRWLESRHPGVPVVRVMPNLPATVGSGFAAIVGGRLATARHRALARELFEAVGRCREVPERYLDAVTAVSGSGPAYVFFLVDAWQRAAQALGLPEAIAGEAIRATLTGSARLLEASAESAEALMRRVASKRGTTEAALQVLARRRVQAAFGQAIEAAARRSRALSWP